MTPERAIAMLDSERDPQAVRLLLSAWLAWFLVDYQRAVDSLRPKI